MRHWLAVMHSFRVGHTVGREHVQKCTARNFSSKLLFVKFCGSIRFQSLWQHACSNRTI